MCVIVLCDVLCSVCFLPPLVCVVLSCGVCFVPLCNFSLCVGDLLFTPMCDDGGMMCIGLVIVIVCAGWVVCCVLCCVLWLCCSLPLVLFLFLLFSFGLSSCGFLGFAFLLCQCLHHLLFLFSVVVACMPLSCAFGFGLSSCGFWGLCVLSFVFVGLLLGRYHTVFVIFVRFLCFGGKYIMPN